MSINSPEVFLNENGTKLYIKECKKHGLGYHYISMRNNKPRYRCCECSKEYNAKNDYNGERQLKKQQIIDYMGGCCVVCGYNKCNYAFECHHEDPTKKEHTIAQLKNKKWEKILKEIEKCILVCSNCHRDIHSSVNIKNIPVNKHNWLYRKLIYKFNNEKCFICGNNNIYNVAYHHIDPKTKSFNIGSGISDGKTLEETTNECKKCVLLCINCHREYHSGYFHQHINFISTFNDELYQEYLIKNENIKKMNNDKSNERRNERRREREREKRKNNKKQERKKQEPKNICINCGEKTNNDKFCSKKCFDFDQQKVKEMNSEILTKLIQIYTYQQIGDMYGVSGNTVKKWCKKYNIEYIDKRKMVQ